MISIIDIVNEFTFETSRSGGKGGQNVNKVESKVSLLWNYEKTTLLTETEKQRLKERAKSYLCSHGIRITSQKSRSQLDNKQNTIQKLNDLLVVWLKVEKKRKPTRIPRSVKRKRLKNKKINSDIKKSRTNKNWDN